MTFYEFFIQYILPVLGTALSAFLTWGSVVLIKYLNTKIKNKELASFTETIITIVTNATKATYQTFVESIKGTSEWNEETQEKARQMTLATVKEELTTDALAYIEKQHGDVDKYILNLVHSILYDLKNKPQEVENQVA